MTTAHETSDAFSDETLREQAVFQFSKEAEMKEMLGGLADGQIEFYKAVGLSRIDTIYCLLTNFKGDGRMGQDYTRNTTYSCGRLIATLIYFIYYFPCSCNLGSLSLSSTGFFFLGGFFSLSRWIFSSDS